MTSPRPARRVGGIRLRPEPTAGPLPFADRRPRTLGCVAVVVQRRGAAGGSAALGRHAHEGTQFAALHVPGLAEAVGLVEGALPLFGVRDQHMLADLAERGEDTAQQLGGCLLYTSPSPRD